MRLAFQSGSQTPYYNPALSGIGVDLTFPEGASNTSYDPSGTDPESSSIAEGIFGGAVSGAMIGYQAASALGSSHEWKNAAVGGIAGGLALAGTIAAGTVAGAPLAPFLFAAAALVGPIASMFKGCGATCTQATQIANKAEIALSAVRDQYLAQPIHYVATQRAALAAFDNIAGQMYKACSNPALGPAGQRCISERLVQGGSAPWCPTGTGCDWITTIRGPIANDPDVVPDPPMSVSQTLASGGSLLDSTVGGFPMPLLLIGGGLLFFALKS